MDQRWKSVGDFFRKFSESGMVLSVRSFHDRHTLVEHEFSKISYDFEYVFDHDVDDGLESSLVIFSHDGGLEDAVRSLILKHAVAWKRLVESGKEHAMIFEDDVVFVQDGIKHLSEISIEISKMSPPYMVYFGGAEAKIPWDFYRSRRVLIRREMYTSECYLIDKTAAAKRLAWLSENEANLPVDHLIVHMDKQLGIPHYWSMEPLVVQASMTGALTSSLSHSRKKHSSVVNGMMFQWKKFKRRTMLKWIVRTSQILQWRSTRGDEW